MTTWHILKVRPCSEFKVRDGFIDREIATYVPVEFAASRFGRGSKTVRKAPVIRGYVFADIGLGDWHVLSKLREVVGAVFVDGRPAALTQRQVDALELLSRPFARANAAGWAPGDRARVRRGAFAELEGIVSEIKKGKVIMSVELLGKVHSVPVSEDSLEAA